MDSRDPHSVAEAEASKALSGMTTPAPDAGNPGHVVTRGLAAHGLPSGPLTLPKDALIPSRGAAAPEDAVIRESWVSFASTAASRDSAAPSIFSVRASTASASTRYSVRQSSIESPTSATSPLYPEHHKPSFSHGPRYHCTFCDASFDSKTEWKLHELDVHDRRERYVCGNCPAVFPRAVLLAEHRNGVHGLDNMTGTIDSVQYSAIRTAWGCGFCAASVGSRNDYLDHVGIHYNEGKEKSEWQHTRVIEGLLDQPKVKASWMALVAREEQARGAKLRFSWEPIMSGRSVEGREPRSLQDMLEFFATGTTNPDEVAAAAYSAALIRHEGNVSDLISKLFLRNSEPMSSRSALTPVQPSPDSLPASPGAAEDVSPISPLPAPLQSVIGPTQHLPLQRPSSHSTFAANMAFRTSGPNSRMAETFKDDASQPSAMPGEAVKFAREVAGPIGSHSLKQNFLRRIDSARDLAPSNHGPNITDPAEMEDTVKTQLSTKRFARMEDSMWLRGQFSMASLHVPPISVQGEAETRVSSSRASIESSPASKTGNCLSVKPSTPSSVRPYTSSSTLSTRTGDGSHEFDDSTSEVMSDDSLSEPDSWLEFDGIATATKGWKMSFQRTVDRGMGHLWARYNHDWDALIKQCAGERSNSTSQSREASGRVRKGASSRQTLGKGLRPNARPPAEDDEEDDDDGEGHRPASSLSKRSSGSAKRFACPFRKHDPQTYNVQGFEVCAIRSWSTISRLKEHLYRRHYKVHCQRCKQIFSDAKELADHEMSLVGCEVLNIIHPGDITSYQEKQLKSRKHTARRQTDEEKWRDIYRLLFPSEEVPSPYPEPAEDLGPMSSESQVSLSFQHFLLTEMPRLFTRTAEEHAGRSLQTHDGLPMEAIPKIIEDSLHRAFRAWGTRGNDVPTREASVASMSFLPDTPNTLAYTFEQPTAYLTPQLSAGLDHSFSHQSLGTGAGFNSNLAHVSHADDSGFVEGSFFTSEPPADFSTFAPQYGRGTWEPGLGLMGGGTFEDDPSMGGHFRGFRNA